MEQRTSGAALSRREALGTAAGIAAAAALAQLGALAAPLEALADASTEEADRRALAREASRWMRARKPSYSRRKACAVGTTTYDLTYAFTTSGKAFRKRFEPKMRAHVEKHDPDYLELYPDATFTRVPGDRSKGSEPCVTLLQVKINGGKAKTYEPTRSGVRRVKVPARGKISFRAREECALVFPHGAAGDPSGACPPLVCDSAWSKWHTMRNQFDHAITVKFPMGF